MTYRIPRRPGKMPQQRSGGFTLVEMLVVLALVATLLGILLPTINSQRARSQLAVCSNNLRQLSSAYQMYASDNDGFLPPYQDRTNLEVMRNGKRQSVSARPDLMTAALHGYLRNSSVWFCPADPNAGTASNLGHVDHRYTSYSTGILASAQQPCPMLSMLEGAQFPVPPNSSPSTCVMLTDNLWVEDQSASLQYSHNGTFNYLYFDGHVRAFDRGDSRSDQ